MAVDDFRIGFLLEDLDGGGIQKNTIALLREFRRRRIHADIMIGRASGPLLDSASDEFTVRSLSKKPGSLYRSLPALTGILKRGEYTHIISGGDRMNLICTAAQLVSLNFKTTIIRTVRTHITSESRNATSLSSRMIPHFVKIFYRFPGVTVAVSKALADHVASLIGADPAEVLTIYNPSYDPTIEELGKKPVVHRWFKDRERPVLVNPCRYSLQKDLPTLIEAVGILRKSSPVNLLVIGGEVLGEEDYKNKMAGIVRKLGLDDCVELSGYEVNPYKFLSKADLYVSSSLWEGFPKTLVEALALGVTPVVTDCPTGPQETLDSGKYGKLVPMKNPQAMADAIRDALHHKLDGQMLRERAREFSVERAADEYLRIISRDKGPH